MGNIRSLDKFSFATFQAFLFGLIGLLAGFIYSVGGFFYDLIFDEGLNTGSTLAFFALIAMPLLFSITGFVLGLLEAILYNYMLKGLVEQN